MPMSAGDNNRAIYDAFWAACSDFTRYNPGSRHRRRILGEMIAALIYRSVLDVGCGDAQNLLWLRAHSPAEVTFTGVDLSARTIAENRARHPFARFLPLDIEREVLPETFDLVTCCEVIEHLDAPADAIRNLAQLVAPGGHLLLTCPTGKVHATERHWGHVAHPTAAELPRLFAGTGLEIVVVSNWGFPFYVALKYVTNFNARWAVDNFAAGAYSRMAKTLSTALYFTNFFNLRSSPLGCELFVLARKPLLDDGREKRR